MTKSDYVNVLVNALVTLKLEGTNRLMDDIIYISLSMYEETRNLVVWNNCEDSKDMLEETIIPGLSMGEVRVCYTLKDENILFNYPIDEE